MRGQSPRSRRGTFKFQDVTGQRFGRLKVLALTERRGGATGGKYFWRCKCDCGNLRDVDISNLNNKSTKSCGCLKLQLLQSQKGEKHPNWQGGRVSSHKSGYIFIHKPDHPNAAKSGYIVEHRLVMEDAIGRYLYPDETVHHKNGVKTDNNIENLELWTGNHCKGQRVSDMLAWAKEIIQRYGDHQQEAEWKQHTQEKRL